MLKIYIYWHKCSCDACPRTHAHTECEDRARILKQNSQYQKYKSVELGDQLGPAQIKLFRILCSRLIWSGCGPGGLHFVFGAFPQHILLHFPNNLCHFPNNFASFPQQFCFISPTICFTSPTIWFISPTIWVISPNHFLISPTILCQFAPLNKSEFFEKMSNF